MQNTSSRSNKKFLKIPGEEVFLHTFKFNANLPLPPIPYAKTLYYPLNSERYSKPKITTFQLKNMAPLLTKCDLGIPVDQLNMKSYLYNAKGGKLDEMDEKLINEELEVTKENSLENSPKKENDNFEEESNKSQNQENENRYQNDEEEDEKVMTETAFKIKIQQNFEAVKEIKEGSQHSTKKGVTCKKIYPVLHDFDDLEQDYVSVFDHNLKGKVKTNKYLIKSAIDKDRQEIFQIFDFITQKEFETKDKKPEKTSDNGMEEEELPKEEAENQNNQEKFEKFVLNKEYNFKRVANYTFTKTPLSENKRDVMIILDEENNKAILKEFKANIILMNSKFSRDPNTDRESEDFITIETRKSNKNDLKIRRKKLFEIEHRSIHDLQKKIDEMIDEEKDNNEKEKSDVEDYQMWEFQGKKEEEQKEQKDQKEIKEIKEQKDEKEEKDNEKDNEKERKERLEKPTKNEKNVKKEEEHNEDDSDSSLFSPEKSDEE